MSKLNQKSFIPKKSSFRGNSTAMTSQKANTTVKSNGEESLDETRRGFTLPAFSLPRKPLEKYDMEKLKERVMRRHAPKGEDRKEIQNIIASIKAKRPTATVQEFVGLISPYTIDNGTILRQVLHDDLSTFRKLARKVYETMTQDVSDVLTNEQVDLNAYYKEKKEILNKKILDAVNEIFLKVPNFDFEKYEKEPNYLSKLLPIPPVFAEDSDELALMRRQVAYHRYQWLKSEGERLNEENIRLQERLNELKQIQRDQQLQAVNREDTAAQRKADLEFTERDAQETLMEMSEAMEKSMVEKEEDIRVDMDTTNLDQSRVRARAKKRGNATTKKDIRPDWNAETAVGIESDLKEQSLHMERLKTTQGNVSCETSKLGMGTICPEATRQNILQTTRFETRNILNQQR